MRREATDNDGRRRHVVIDRRGFLWHTGTIAAAGLGAAGLANAQDRDRWPNEHDWLDIGHVDSNPDAAHLLRWGGGWKVLPTGHDDHDNLEWALRNTVSGGTVRLVPGTYKIGSPILVPDFDGRLVGAGAARTTITCSDEFSYELWEAPGGGKDRNEPPPPPFPRRPIEGSTTRSAPVLINFYKTPLQPGERPESRANRIEIRNIRCRGAMKGELWAFGDEVLCINIVNSLDWHHPESAPATTRQDVLISGLEVDGYSTPSFGPFENACACVTVLGGPILTSNYDLTGDVNGDALGLENGGLLGVTPAEGDVTFISCAFRNCRLGPGVVGHKNSLLRFENISTDGCRGNCLQIVDADNCQVSVRSGDLRCDSFVLPPELVGGVTDYPSSLGCVVALQGAFAAVGVPYNVRWHTLANDPVAHAAHPEAGPLGTWRPLGPAAAPRRSVYEIADNQCESAMTPNTYCIHVIDAARVAFGVETVRALVYGNRCEGSETCIALEHVDDGRVVFNECSSQAFGLELHNSRRAIVRNNSFEFPPSGGCKIRVLELGEKIDFSRVVPGAGVCVLQ
jgi:hypothetical protein